MREQVNFRAPAAVNRALRERAERLDIPISRLALRYVREGLAREGALNVELAAPESSRGAQ